MTRDVAADIFIDLDTFVVNYGSANPELHHSHKL